MQNIYAPAALAALLLIAALPAQVPPEIQAVRTDALVLVTHSVTGQPIQEAAVTFAIPLTQSLYTVHTDQNGVAYCGDRNSELSVFEFGRDAIAFEVSHPSFASEHVACELPPVEGKCVNVTKTCQTFAVQLGPKKKEEWTVGQPATPPPVPCEYREVFVKSYTALCEESTFNYASVFITQGVCASPIDWSNTTSQTKKFEVGFSHKLTSEATAKVGKVLGAKLSASTSITGDAEWSYASTVVFQGKLGTNAVAATLCGHACMNAAQKVIVTQPQRRCCIQPGTLYGCNLWGEWEDWGAEVETRVNTGYCTTEAKLYPCASPPTPIPGCAQ